MSIKHDIDELQKINAEIKRMYGAIKQLRNAKTTIERRISEYLEHAELPAIKDRTKGIVVKLDKKTSRIYDSPKKSRIQESITILQNAGVKDAEDVFSKLKDVGRNSVEKKVLKIDKFM